MQEEGEEKGEEEAPMARQVAAATTAVLQRIKAGPRKAQRQSQ